MIKSFRHKGLRRFYSDDDSSGIDASQKVRIGMILDRLEASRAIIDMNIPGYRLHRLKGDRKDIWSVNVSGNWRITFRFENEDAYDLNLEDYH